MLLFLRTRSTVVSETRYLDLELELLELEGLSVARQGRRRKVEKSVYQNKEGEKKKKKKKKKKKTIAHHKGPRCEVRG